MVEPTLGPAELEQVAVDVATAASSYVRDNVHRSGVVGLKTSHTDAVTQVDIDSEDLITRELLARTPGARVLGEEHGEVDDEKAARSEVTWVVDPIDGTVNFLYGVPVYAVSIAAAVSGVVVAGAVADVARAEIFSAHLGGGARLDGREITVAGCSDIADALVMTGFAYQRDERMAQGMVAREVLGTARDLRCFGSTAVELAWVACGRGDAYYQTGTKLWDWAAGALIADEAGAVLELPCPENDGLIVAASPGVFEDLRQTVAAHGWPR
jgi:myo-inositol-1(or 4)-monophosphatase